MIRRRESFSQFIAFWLYRIFVIKARIYFLTKISEFYLSVAAVPSEEAKEDIVLGYEAGWPRHCKKLR